MSDIRRGLIIVNTGPGKGKTTAAMETTIPIPIVESRTSPARARSIWPISKPAAAIR